MKTKPHSNNPASAVATLPGRLTRSQVAKEIGRSLATVRRMEQGNVLTPTVGPGGVRLFAAEQVETIKRTRIRAVHASTDADGPTAAEVFTLLDEQVHAVDIVKRLQVHPDIVESLHEEWARLRGGFVVTPDVRKQLEGVDLLGWEPIADAETLLVAVRGTVEGSQRSCARCSKRPARICGDCSRERREAAELRGYEKGLSQGNSLFGGGGWPGASRDEKKSG